MGKVWWLVVPYKVNIILCCSFLSSESGVCFFVERARTKSVQDRLCIGMKLHATIKIEFTKGFFFSLNPFRMKRSWPKIILSFSVSKPNTCKFSKVTRNTHTYTLSTGKIVALMVLLLLASLPGIESPRVHIFFYMNSTRTELRFSRSSSMVLTLRVQ